MKGRLISSILCLILAFSILFSFSGCGPSLKAINLMEGIQAGTPHDAAQSQNGTSAAADFDIALFRHSFVSDDNMLISPLSALAALALTANGARGETLSQMEQVFGLSDNDLNNYLGAYLKGLPSNGKCKIISANSIWLRDSGKLTANQDFLQANADYYGAYIYKAAFSDATLKEINKWAEDKTDGMVKNILNSIPNSAVMYLINALAFDGEWESIYGANQVKDGSFTPKTGKPQNVKMMYGVEGAYLDDGKAVGFLKYYAGRKYAFAALLPNDGVSINDYVASLTGDTLLNTLRNAQAAEVKTAIPKFESEYSVELADILKSMGMTDAFDAKMADFTGICKSSDGRLFISRIIQKTAIAVNERGTKAGAATAVEMSSTGTPSAEAKTVFLNRPFIYMLIDCDNNLPIFIGVMMNPLG